MESKEKTIGEFKTKIKFISFISSVGNSIRITKDSAFIEGRKISGLYDNLTFKITICDEGINFEEVDTNIVTKEQIKRIIEDIESSEITEYARRYVVKEFLFYTEEKFNCYIEVEQKKPIDKLKSLFEGESILSKKGSSFLDDLFGNDDFIPKVEEKVEEVKIADKSEYKTFMEEEFKKANQAKAEELKRKIEEKGKESIKVKNDIKQAEAKIKAINHDLMILDSRLESFNVNDLPNGYVFFIEEVKQEKYKTSKEEDSLLEKVSNLFGVEKEKIVKLLFNDSYNIHVADKSDNEKELPDGILEKVRTILSYSSFDSRIINRKKSFIYSGDLKWHDLVKRMIRMGFEQDSEFDKKFDKNK